MNGRLVCLYLGGALVDLVGLACAFGASVLWRGNTANWPDVVGSPAAIRNTAMGLGLAALLLLGSSAGVFMRAPWGFPAAAGAMLLFVAGGFWGNYAVFGDMRLVHTLSNAVIAAAAIALLWFGHYDSHHQI